MSSCDTAKVGEPRDHGRSHRASQYSVVGTAPYVTLAWSARLHMAMPTNPRSVSRARKKQQSERSTHIGR
ncbi:hypothetical protein BDV95DRAFT_569895 [Massariosphaeria phaeospora]|uniref:Uncharacterized protein n=1 Tax=Massariosphaeria phaeospora TaxID=100035 RepID=A0A7C8IAT6_9PLEO|nr:hypothetical protein BDV95DRAFT_569895 [Massariosphaeria phaeospora]